MQSDLDIRRDSGEEQTTHNHQRLLTRRGTSTGAPSHPANILRQSVYSTHLHLRIYFKSTWPRLASTSTRLLQVNASTTSVYCCTGTRHGGKFLYAMSQDRQAINSTMHAILRGSVAAGGCAITSDVTSDPANSSEIYERWAIRRWRLAILENRERSSVWDE